VNHYYNFIYPLLELGRFEQAEGLFKRLEIEKGDDGFLLNWSGFIYQSWYELKSEDELHLTKGLELYEKSTLLIDKAYGRYSLRKYENLENLGYTYGLMGDANRGLQYLDQAIEIVGKSYRTYTTYKLGNLYEMKAQALLNANKPTEALNVIDKSDLCKLLQVDADSSEMSWNYHTRAHILLALDRKAEAKAFLKRALDIRIAEMGEANDVTADTQREYDEISL
jgi:tetratricopeptide (TPR) repeat protein